jgi:hypothetical protein
LSFFLVFAATPVEIAAMIGGSASPTAKNRRNDCRVALANATSPGNYLKLNEGAGVFAIEVAQLPAPVRPAATECLASWHTARIYEV